MSRQLTWVRNYALNWRTKEPAKSSTSQWHLLHSVRANPSAKGNWYPDGFALTVCGQVFENPRSWYRPSGAKRKCSSCATVAWALENTIEVPDELVIREDS